MQLEVLNTLEKNDPQNRWHCVHLREWFDYRGHVCMVRTPCLTPCVQLGPLHLKFRLTHNIGIHKLHAYAQCFDVNHAVRLNALQLPSSAKQVCYHLLSDEVHL